MLLDNLQRSTKLFAKHTWGNSSRSGPWQNIVKKDPGRQEGRQAGIQADRQASKQASKQASS